MKPNEKIENKTDMAASLAREFPTATNTTLARALCKRFPSVFTSVETARRVVLYAKGASGEKTRKHARLVAPLGKAHNPLALPVDFYMLSRFSKSPLLRNVEGERLAVVQFWKSLRKVFPKQRIIYKYGNHDERFDLYLCSRAPELCGVSGFSVEDMIKCDEYEIETIKDKRPVYAGALTILHGHEHQGGAFAPVNPARGLFLQCKRNALKGHNHQTSEHSEPDVRGELITTWSVGGLLQLHPAYMPFNKWNHGLATVELTGKAFEVNNLRILAGKIL